MKQYMNGKFEMSNDGIMRRSFSIKVRLTASQIADIRAIMLDFEGAKGEKAIRIFLDTAMQIGIEDGIINYQERREAKGR